MQGSGEVEMFTAYRVQHNNALGPFKGGLVFHPDVNVNNMVRWALAHAHAQPAT